MATQVQALPGASSNGSAAPDAQSSIRARQTSFMTDVTNVAGRAIRRAAREPENFVGIIIPLFFYVVFVGALENLTSQSLGLDFRAFQLPVAIITAVTGVSQAVALVNDIKSGYFDRLLMTPINRLALLLGLMAADFVLVTVLILPVLAVGFLYGVTFVTGIAGLMVFILSGALWGLVFAGFPYTIALRTASPSAVNLSFVLFFPFVFMTTNLVPEEALSGWFQAVVRVNPVTYLLEGQRSLISEGWDGSALAVMFGAIAAVGVLTFTMALTALRGRVSRG